MNNVLLLVRYQWVSYWRGLRRITSVRAANQGILLLILALVAIKYLELLRVASHNIANGKSALLGALLAGVFVAWLFPVSSSPRVTLPSRLMLHLPLSTRELFVARQLSLFISPVAWLVVVASLAICYPLAYAPNPGSGFAAALLFIVASWQIGFCATQLLGFSLWRKLFGLIVLGGLLVAAVYFRNGFAGSELGQLGRFSPTTLVTNSALGIRVAFSLGVLTVIAVAAMPIAFWSFRLSLGRATTRSRRKKLFGSLRMPGRLGGLIAKDLRYFPRLLDTYFGVLASVLCAVHLVVAATPSADVVRIFILVVFLGNSALAFNLFGLDDKNGLDRYTLLPLTGWSTLLSKNLAFAILVAMQLFPVFLLSLWRLGLWESLGAIVQSISLAAAYLAWGNWMSVTHPLKLSFFRFSSSGSALPDIIGGLIFGSLPGVVAIYALREGTSSKLLVVTAALFFATVYVLSLVKFGRTFERRREALVVALTDNS